MVGAKASPMGKRPSAAPTTTTAATTPMTTSSPKLSMRSGCVRCSAPGRYGLMSRMVPASVEQAARLPSGAHGDGAQHVRRERPERSWRGVSGDAAPTRRCLPPTYLRRAHPPLRRLAHNVAPCPADIRYQTPMPLARRLAARHVHVLNVVAGRLHASQGVHAGRPPSRVGARPRRAARRLTFLL